MGQKTYLRKYKSFFKAGNQVYLFILVNFDAPGRIPNTDPNPDPGEPNQCGSIRIRIHNTGYNTYLDLVLVKVPN